MASQTDHSEINHYITIADDVNKIFHNSPIRDHNDRVFMPEIVFIGTQSAGKSSQINKLIGWDIIPTGNGMVTRSPIKVRLHNHDSKIEIQISYNDNGIMNVLYKSSFDVLEIHDVKIIQKKLIDETVRLAGSNNISRVPIYLDISYPDACELSFVDLPGLVTIAKTDIGQSETIVEEIKTLARDYIARPNTIVVTIIEANLDLETNLALSLVKELQRSGQVYKCLGVLTKPDIVHDKERIVNIVAGRMSKAVMLDLGYFVVNSIVQDEDQYFRTFGNNIDTTRCGSNILRRNLSMILVEAIKRELPKVIKDLRLLKERTNETIQRFGDDLTDNESKMRFISNLVTNISEIFNNSIRSLGVVPNIGAEIKVIFDNFKDDIDSIRPFTMMPDSYFEKVIDSFKGYLTNNVISQHSILDNCIRDPVTRPIMKLLPKITTCIDQVESALSRGFNAIIQSQIDSMKHHELITNMKDYQIDLLKEFKKDAIEYITKSLEIEETLVQSSDRKFYSALNKDRTISNDDNSDGMEEITELRDSLNLIENQPIAKSKVQSLRRLGDTYFMALKYHIHDTVIKTIHHMLIEAIKREIPNKFFQQFLNEKGLSSLKEDRETIDEKKRLHKLTDNIDKSISMITTV